ncbi:MAG: hypothetical protein KME32_17495 [Mojavia pulchra JT2-VF2]|uniref:Uncharacterized protein n=1 Tax=Mojavia pulchra JT2-VF2 TaxID=287848 RepID=A0A951PZF4_9NOST|nr:hypothetical protein [Mojavia pulchra JT2-VF2]
MAARLAWKGIAEVIPYSRLSVSKLQTAIQRILTQDSYKKNALNLGISYSDSATPLFLPFGKPLRVYVSFAPFVVRSFF